MKGAWFEARIVKIMSGDDVAGGDGLAYHIVYEGYPDFGPVKVLNHINYASYYGIDPTTAFWVMAGFHKNTWNWCNSFNFKLTFCW